MKSALTFFFMLGCLGIALAQGTDKPGTPKQDPEAVKLIQKFDSLQYVPRVNGLKDVEFATKLPSGHNLLLRWKAPSKSYSELVVPPDAPADRARQLAFIIPKLAQEARKYETAFLNLQTGGELLWETVQGDEITLVAPNQVKVVAKSDSSKSKFKEQTITFDDAGLAKLVKLTAPTGLESVTEATFKEWNKKFFYQTVKTSLGGQESTIDFEFAPFGDVMLIKKVTTTAKPGGASRTLEFFDFKVNTNLDDKLFEPKAAESKPQ